MRSTRILLIFLLATSLLSCKKDDDGNVTAFLLSNENLSGIYELIFFQSTLVETTNVNGLDIVSTTTNTGDTFEVDYTFTENGRYSAEGLFRIVFTVVVNGETTQEDAFIETISIQNASYSVTSSSSILVLDEKTYEVILFNESEFRITLEEIRTFSNGDTEMYNEELRFVRK
jgi:hypothetical protein